VGIGSEVVPVSVGDPSRGAVDSVALNVLSFSGKVVTEDDDEGPVDVESPVWADESDIVVDELVIDIVSPEMDPVAEVENDDAEIECPNWSVVNEAVVELEIESLRLRLVPSVVPVAAVVEADKVVIESVKAVSLVVIPVTVLSVVNDGSVLTEDDIGSVAVAVPPVICVLEDARDVVVIKLVSVVMVSAPVTEVVKPVSVVEKSNAVDVSRSDKPVVVEDRPVTRSV